MSLRDEIRNRLRDVNMNFLQSICVAAPWQYSELSKSLMARDDLSACEKHERFIWQRADCMNKALKICAKQHGIPHEMKRLPCNGQHKLLMKSGRVVIIQDTLQETGQRPKVADFKEQLASSMGVIQQLELDLGDRPGRILDWQDSTLAVLLHGLSGSMHHQDGISLGGMYLAIPDNGFQNWLLRFELSDVAYNGFNSKPDDTNADMTTAQPDNVHVVLRNQRKKAEGR